MIMAWIVQRRMPWLPVLRSPATIEASAKVRQHVDHVLCKIILHLGLIDNNKFAFASRECRRDVL
jgi:hypothetical protein